MSQKVLDLEKKAMGQLDSSQKDSLLRPSSEVSNLQHLAYLCPGLHGPDSRQDINSVPLSSFIEPGCPTMLIPLFQRRYCWGKHIFSAWWKDVVKITSARLLKGGQRQNMLDNRSYQNRHRCGQAVFKLMKDGRLCILDGQQRVTTSLLIIAALRDVAVAQGNIDIASKCNRALFRNHDQWIEWYNRVKKSWKPLNNGYVLPFATLIPSFADRSSFFELLTVGAIAGATFSLATVESRQGAAYNYFGAKIKAELRRNGGLNLEDLAILALDGISITRVDILNDINYGQVFLHLQEKALFSMGSLLFNPTPGEGFASTDLVRNLLIAPFMNLDIDQQERIFNDNWTIPIEIPSKGPEDLQMVLKELLDSLDPPVESLPQSTFQKTLDMMSSSNISLLKPGVSVTTYARYVTYYEECCRELSSSPSPEELQQVALGLMKEIAHFVRTRKEKLEG